jgi:hypothetical protein
MEPEIQFILASVLVFGSFLYASKKLRLVGHRGKVVYLCALRKGIMKKTRAIFFSFVQHRCSLGSSFSSVNVCSVSRWTLALGVSKILTLIERMTLRDGVIFWVYFSHNVIPT